MFIRLKIYLIVGSTLHRLLTGTDRSVFCRCSDVISCTQRCHIKADSSWIANPHTKHNFARLDLTEGFDFLFLIIARKIRIKRIQIFSLGKGIDNKIIIYFTLSVITRRDNIIPCHTEILIR